MNTFKTLFFIITSLFIFSFTNNPVNIDAATTIETETECILNLISDHGAESTELEGYVNSLDASYSADAISDMNIASHCPCYRRSMSVVIYFGRRTIYITLPCRLGRILIRMGIADCGGGV